MTVFNLEDIKSLSDFVFISHNLLKFLPTFQFHHAVRLNNTYNKSIFISRKIILYPVPLQLQLLGSFKELQWLWCGFDRASSIIRGNKMPTRCNRWIFIADRIATSTCFGHHYAHHQELENKAAARKPDTQHSAPHYTDNSKTKHQIRQAATTCIILSRSWWWA